MPDLVPEVAEQGPVILAEQHPPPLALDVVGLGDVHRDEAVEVARQHGRPHPVALGRIDQEVEGEARHGVLGAGHQRQPEPHQGVEHPVLGGLDLAPAGQVPADGEVGDDAVVAAGGAEPLGCPIGNQPVAGIVGGIGAEAVLAGRIGIGVPEVSRGFEGRDLVHAADIAEPALARIATGALEADRLVAGLALEDLHRRVFMAGSSCAEVSWQNLHGRVFKAGSRWQNSASPRGMEWAARLSPGQEDRRPLSSRRAAPRDDARDLLAPTGRDRPGRAGIPESQRPRYRPTIAGL